MKLSDLKPCAACGGPLLKPGQVTWYVVRTSLAMLHPQHARGVISLNTMFDGALGLAEVMSPAADKAVLVMGDEEPKCMTEFFLCFECYCGDVSLAGLAERANEAAAAKKVG